MRPLLALCLLVCPAAFSQATVSTSVSLNVQTTLNKTATSASGGGTGTLQPFGNVVVAVTLSGAPAVGTVNLVLQSGSLTASFPVGSGSPVGSASTYTATVTSGTGQFIGATGSVLITDTTTYRSPTLNMDVLSGSGTIVQPASTANTGSAGPLSLTFNLVAGGAAAAPQTLTLINGSESNTYGIGLKFGLGFGCCSIPSSDVSILPLGQLTGVIATYATRSFSVTVEPLDLAVGTYTGEIDVDFGTGEMYAIPLTAVVTPAPPPAVVPNGLQIAGVAGVDFSQSATVALVNAPAGTASVSTTTAGADSSWLSAVPGNASALISVNAKNLQPGVYYGLVEFAEPPPASALEGTVVFNVASPAAPVTPTLSPTALEFFGSTLSGSVQLTNAGSTPVDITPAALYLMGSNWLTVTPASATIPPAGSVQFTISGVASALQAAIQSQTVFRASVQFQLDSGASVPLEVVYLPPPPASSAAFSAAFSNSPLAVACVPTLIQPVFTSVPSSFSTTAGWPVWIEVEVLDNCGMPVTAVSVTAAFTSGDPPLNLESIGAGNWSGTWEPHDVNGSNVGITVTATNPQGLVGTDQLEGGVLANHATPSISTGGVVSAVDFAPVAPLAPGDYIAIFGTQLATALGQSNAFPLKTQILGTQVIVGGQTVPVKFVSSGQINAQLPYGLPANSVQQVIVQQNAQYSMPEPVTIASTAPAVISADGSGMGQGVVTVVQSNGTQFPNSAANPASAGDTLVVYCVGLGAVTPPVIEGAAAPSSPPANTTNPVTVTIGGIAAQPSFAGLTPGYAGLYQVNVQVPSGVTSGSAVPLVLTVNGGSSSGATIAVQ